MDKDLLMPTATIVAALLSKPNENASVGADSFDIKAEFFRVYELLKEAKEEIKSYDWKAFE